MRWVDPVPELKRQLGQELVREMEGASQVWAAWGTHLARSRISEIRRGNLDNVSLERLIHALSYSGYVVEIRIERRGKRATWTGESPASYPGNPIGFIS